jgi:alpha-L-rhamnosidase
MFVKNLLCEQLESPIGVDSKNPQLGWILAASDSEQGKKQTAYQILVTSSLDELNKNNGTLWDSGKQKSDASAFVKYAGKGLQSRMKYYWKVKVWDEAGKESEWSQPSYWIMGAYPQDWKGEWIGEWTNVSYEDRFPISKELEDCPGWLKAAARRDHPNGPGPENKFAMAIYLRKGFKVTSPIERAIIRVAGLGYNEVYLNGEKIGDHVLDPGATDYTKTVLYVSYDVSKLINSGTIKENCLGVILGNGWYWVGTPDLFGFDKALWATPPKCRLELELTYKNGKTEFISTDKTWSCSDQGPIRFNCIRSGEIYDARMELGEWSTLGGLLSDDQQWKPALVVPAPSGVLRSQLSPPIKINDVFGPCNRVILDNRAIVYWFPKNNAGWVSLKIKGSKGQTVKIELNELLHPDGSVNMDTHSGHTYGRYQTCEYICKGDGIESYHPRFCYAGFQYVQITGVSPDQIIEILAHQVGTSFETSGEFVCSDLLINTINAAAKSTFRNGFHSYPEDCPQREKAGWTEDALLSSQGSIYNFNALWAYKKWIRDIMDAQHEPSGQVPDIVPTPLWGKPSKVIEKGKYEQWNQEYLGNMADPWWGGVLVMLPWTIYQHYGDIGILETAYPNMKKYVEFLLKTTETPEGDHTYLINWGTMLGEWLEVGSGGSANRTPRILTCTQAFFSCATVLANTAALLGNNEDSKRYKEIATNIAKAVNEEFLDVKTGLYAKDSQSAQSMSLVLGLVPEDAKQKVFEQLVTNVVEVRDGHLSTGIVGSYFVYKALSQFGRPDLAYQVITARGFPGFEHNLTRSNATTPIPSTTLWEDWGGVSSLAHPVQGMVVSFFYEWLAGIQRDEKAVGFKRFKIVPQIITPLQWVKASLPTLYGTIVSNWELKGDDIIMNVQVPLNTEAEIVIPCHSIDKIRCNTEPLKVGNGIMKITEGKSITQITLGSGKYVITFPNLLSQ